MRAMRFALLLALVAAACGREQPASAGPATPPRLAFAADSVSFGTKFDDEIPSVTATLKNLGGTTLHVERLEPSCGCILVGEAPKTIAPGASVDLPMEIRLVGIE